MFSVQSKPKANLPVEAPVNTGRNAALKKKANEERVAQLPVGSMGNPGNRLMKFTNRVRGINRVGYGNTRSENQWVKNKSRGQTNMRKYIYSVPRNNSTPLKVDEWSKYRNPNMAKAVHDVPRRVSPEIPLESILGPQPATLGGRSRRKTRKNKKSRKNRR